MRHDGASSRGPERGKAGGAGGEPAGQTVYWRVEIPFVSQREVELLRGLLLEVLAEMQNEEDHHRD